jgi:hypothetical protein
MIEIIEKILVAEGLLFDKSSVEYNFEDQVSLIYHMRLKKGKLVTAKVVQNGLGEMEFRSQKAAFEAFPRFVPQPLFYRKIDKRELLFFECVPHKNLNTKYMFSQRNAWQRDLPLYFQDDGTVFFDEKKPIDNDYLHLLATFEGKISAHLLSSARRILDKVDLEKYANTRPRIQHGDFSVNNMGVREGRLVIFDWENHGISNTNGLDFTVLVASALRHSSREIAALLRGKPHALLSKIVEIFTKKYSLSEDELIALFLICYMRFLKMKIDLDYGGKIISQLETTIAELFEIFDC